MSLSVAGFLDDLAMALRLLSSLPGYLRHPLALDEALGSLRQRLERREPDFLDLARATIFANPASPYRALLRHAGCEYGDLERLVRQDGVEGALRVLHREGLYLTVEEFKGRLVEEETSQGQPRLRLLVAPSVGSLDPSAVSDVFLAAIAAGSGTARVMALQWQQGALLSVERRPPLLAPSGKILHLWAASGERSRPTDR
jgi:hypothetical protein